MTRLVVWGGIALLVVLMITSLFVGARAVSVAHVWDALSGAEGDPFDVSAIRDQRLPRTFLAVIVGACLATAGVLLQAMTRNPLADPGVLGVNAGAAFAVVMSVSLGIVSTLRGYIGFAFLGALVTTILVYLLALAGGPRSTPIRLVLSGMAISAAVTALVQAVISLDRQAFNEFRYWATGSLEGRGWDTLWVVLPVALIGIVAATFLGRPLDAMALGATTGRALGVNIGRIRTSVVIVVALLSGAATAAVGPVAFVGLAVPHMARTVAGANQMRVLAYSLVWAPSLLLGADIIGRIASDSGEVGAGVVVALVGAPLLVAMLRSKKAVGI